MPQAYSFHPLTKRRLIGNLIFFLVYLLGFSLFNNASLGYFLLLGAISLVTSFVIAYDQSGTIKINNGKVFGSSVSGFKQVEFELTAVDKRRTKQQSLWNKLNGRTIIYAKGGQKIQINHTSFDKTKRAEILNALRLNEYP